VAARICGHGFEAGSCLICATLAAAPPGQALTGGKAPPEARDPGRRLRRAGATEARDPGRRLRRAGAAPTIPAGRAEVLAPRQARRAGRGLAGMGTVAVLVAVVLAGWWALGLVWAFVRLIELAAVGIGCGWVGYRMGVARGRRSAR